MQSIIKRWKLRLLYRVLMATMRAIERARKPDEMSATALLRRSTDPELVTQGTVHKVRGVCAMPQGVVEDDACPGGDFAQFVEAHGGRDVEVDQVADGAIYGTAVFDGERRAFKVVPA